MKKNNFKVYATEKINECNTLMANQPMTSDLAKNIYEIACHLRFDCADMANYNEELAINFYDKANALYYYVNNMYEFFNEMED